VDVEIASSPRYYDDDISEEKKREKREKKKVVEKSEGVAPKPLEAVQDEGDRWRNKSYR
jgi:hypothetical protein